MAVPKLVVHLAGWIFPEAFVQRLRAHRSMARGDNPELAILGQFKRKGRFIDVGANIGDYSRVASLIFDQVETFEPIPELVVKLQRELPRNCTVHAIALSNENGTARFSVPIEAGYETTALASLRDLGKNSGNLRTFDVRTATLDGFGFDNIDVIKIDVEGFEAFTIEGARETISRERPVIICEIEDRHNGGVSQEIFDKIVSEGYRVHVLKAGRLVDVGVQVAAAFAAKQSVNKIWPETYLNNFVFVPEER